MGFVSRILCQVGGHRDTDGTVTPAPVPNPSGRQPRGTHSLPYLLGGRDVSPPPAPTPTISGRVDEILKRFHGNYVTRFAFRFRRGYETVICYEYHKKREYDERKIEI